jgi:hypothetical protein
MQQPRISFFPAFYVIIIVIIAKKDLAFDELIFARVKNEE